MELFKLNKMIVNAEKFQAILLNKIISYLTKLKVNVDDKAIKSVSSVDLLGNTLDDKNDFNLHISTICRSAANQLNTLMRFALFLTLKQ